MLDCFVLTIVRNSCIYFTIYSRRSKFSWSGLEWKDSLVCLSDTVEVYKPYCEPVKVGKSVQLVFRLYYKRCGNFVIVLS